MAFPLVLFWYKPLFVNDGRFIILFDILINWCYKLHFHAKRSWLVIQAISFKNYLSAAVYE